MRRMIWWLLISLAALALAGGIALVASVDDWSRDLSTNRAATDERATDPALRPIHASQSIEELAELVVSAAGSLPNWSVQSKTIAGGSATVHLVRTTPLWRFRDDITVQIASDGQQRTIEAVSQSRVGKGDLGQNPRNLRELLAEIRRRLATEGE